MNNIENFRHPVYVQPSIQSSSVPLNSNTSSVIKSTQLPAQSVVLNISKYQNIGKENTDLTYARMIKKSDKLDR